MAAAVTASEEESAGSAPGAFQLPPYKQARPIMWYKQAEALMDMRKITNPAFRLVLVPVSYTHLTLPTKRIV